MMRTPLFLLLATLAVVLAAPAFAEEPKGFADLAWGSGIDEANEKVFRLKCGPIRAAVGDPRPMCPRYELDGIGTVIVGLDFATGDLQGYSITVPNHKAWDFRSALDAKFGTPAGRAARLSSWTWPSGSTATFIEHSPLGSMLVVSTKKAIARTGKDIQQKDDTIKKGF
jgi:hypothetical protein